MGEPCEMNKAGWVGIANLSGEINGTGVLAYPALGRAFIMPE